MLGYVDENNDDLGVWDLGDYEDNHHNNDTKQQSNDTNYHLDLPKGLTPYEHDMDHYINWHKSHPHSSTPRKLRASSIETHVHVCEENPQLAYIQSQKKRPPIPKDFTSKTLGQNAKFKEVTDLAHGIEHEKRLNKRDDHLDPWWMHSVKVQSSIFHAKEPNTNNIYKEEDNEDDIYYDLLQKYQTHQERHEQKLREKEDELAISAAWGKPNRNIKRSKLNKSHRSKYTINGKAELSDYYSDRFEKAVQIALDEYRLAAAEQEQRKKKRSNNQEPEEENNPDIDRNENINNGNQSFISKQLQLLDQQQSSHLSKPLNSTSTAIQPFDTKSTSSTKPKTTTTTRSIKDTNLAKYQEYEDYKNALGGEKGIKNITEKLVKYSKKINQQNQSHDVLSIMDRGMDFLDACLHLNSVQVHCLLSFGADPNSVTCDEEPVFYMIFQKILYIDERVLDEENRKKNSDRKSCIKILSSLLEFGAEINCVVNGNTPLHLACSRGSSIMTQWLLEHHADPNFQSGSDGITPLMIASKFSFPECIIPLIRYEADINKQNYLGRTALHYAAQFGQTKISKFLLRLGAQKDIKDESGLTPGELAFSCNFMATSQVINGYCTPHIEAKQPLTYIISRLNAEDKIKNKKKLFFFDSSGGTPGLLGNLFSEKENNESFFERIYDRVREWKRWFEATPWNEIFSRGNRSSEAMVHPE